MLPRGAGENEVMKRPLLVALWIVATAATTAVAYVAVNAAGAEVTDRPLTSVVASGGTASSTIAGSVSTTGSTESTTATSGSTTSTALSPTVSTPTTAAEAPWQQRTIPSSGGLVIVSYRPEEVRLESVAPSPGFGYEIDETGPPEVRVEFEGGDVRVEVRVRWDGALVIDVDEN